jgi:hypothetical protein
MEGPIEVYPIEVYLIGKCVVEISGCSPHGHGWAWTETRKGSRATDIDISIDLENPVLPKAPFKDSDGGFWISVKNLT